MGFIGFLRISLMIYGIYRIPQDLWDEINSLHLKIFQWLDDDFRTFGAWRNLAGANC